jgi:hypothetical protein
VALHLHSAALLDSVRAAFAHGLDVMLAVCAGIAGLSALLALAFLPRRARAGGRPADQAVTAGSAAPLAPAELGGQDQGHDHARR